MNKGKDLTISLLKEKLERISGKKVSLKEAQVIRKEDLDTIRGEIDRALKPVADKNGWEKLKVGMITWEDSGFSANIKCYTGFVSLEVRRWLQTNNLPSNYIGSTFNYKGKTFTVTEIKPYQKFQVVAVSSEGKELGFNLDFLRSL